MHYDIIILGGGINGILTAVGLKKQALSVVIIDQSCDLLSQSRDRVFALSKKSQIILEDLGIWQYLATEAQPIFEILIKDNNSPISVNYNHKIVNQDAMGYIINSNLLCDALKKLASNITRHSNITYKNIENKNNFIAIKLNDHTKLTASLLICAEGKNSKLRELNSIPHIKYNYNQKSIVFNVQHANNHNGVAIEHFFPGGPFAILPMHGNFESSIVWTEKVHIATSLMNLSEEEFLIELQKKCSPYLTQVNIITQRKYYPLSLLLTEYLYDKRIIFIGDAAHSIHPIAGQGLNLGIKDAYSIINNIVLSKNYGTDIGSDYVLKKFSQERYFDNCLMSLFTHSTNAIFSNNSKLLKMMRGVGLNLIEHSPAIKKYLINHAMGLNNLMTLFIIIRTLIL